jgi:SulP family sulfate permease
MPVGGSMSASSLVVAAGARTRLALLAAGAVMATVIVAFGDLVGHVAMPALAGLLIVVGIGTIKPNQVATLARTGPVPLTVMATTLVLTMLIPLQYAVLVGVAISLILFVAQQSTRLTTKALELTDDGRIREAEPPPVVPPGQVVVLQPYGSLFFATVPTLEQQMPTVGADSADSVVILRIRGVDDVGATLIDVLTRYARALTAAGSKLMLVTDNERIHRQLQVTGAIDAIGEDNLYRGNEWVGDTVRQAHSDAQRWVHERTRS